MKYMVDTTRFTRGKQKKQKAMNKPKGGSQKKSRKLPQKPSYLSTPTQQLRKALTKARATNTGREGRVINPGNFLSKAENQRSRLGLGEAKNVGKKFTAKSRPGTKGQAKKLVAKTALSKRKKLMEKLGKRGTRKGLKNGKLVGGQTKLDANKDGKISKVDFALLKKKKTTKSA